jgi:hypothetical protein
VNHSLNYTVTIARNQIECFLRLFEWKMMGYHEISINFSALNQVQRRLDTMILPADISYGKFFSLERINIKRYSFLPGGSYYDQSTARL